MKKCMALLLSLCLVFCLTLTDCAQQVPDLNLTVMTYNIWSTGWYNRIDLVTKTMLESGADTIGVQEATTAWMDPEYGLPAELSQKYAFIGVGRDDGVSAGEHAAIFYLKDKYKVVEQDTFWLSETPNEPSYGWGANYRRICTWGIFEHLETGVQFVHMNTHFDHQVPEAQTGGLALVIQKAKELEVQGLPVILTGDLNVSQGSDVYNRATEYFIDTKQVATTTMDAGTCGGAVLDYIMVNSTDRFIVNTYHVMTEKEGESDHVPVITQLLALTAGKS